jgi:transcriptional regulator with XRE-family HTH domain
MYNSPSHNHLILYTTKLARIVTKLSIFVVPNCNKINMSLFSDNIRNLRVKQKISQEKLAESLAITRGRYVKYEDGTSEAPYEILKKISQYYHISIDLLLSVDVRKIPMDDLLKLGDNRILLPITVDREGDSFIENLQHISLPWLRNGKFRAFPVDGDSMPPHKSGFFIVGRYVEKLGDVMDGKTYILLTKNEGIVYKRLNKNGKNALVLHSDNAYYKSYEVKASEILEIWEFACSFATEEFGPDDLSPESLKEVLMELRREVREVKEKLS